MLEETGVGWSAGRRGGTNSHPQLSLLGLTLVAQKLAEFHPSTAGQVRLCVNNNLNRGFPTDLLASLQIHLGDAENLFIFRKGAD